MESLLLVHALNSLSLIVPTNQAEMLRDIVWVVLNHSEKMMVGTQISVTPKPKFFPVALLPWLFLSFILSFTHSFTHMHHYAQT